MAKVLNTSKIPVDLYIGPRETIQTKYISFNSQPWQHTCSEMKLHTQDTLLNTAGENEVCHHNVHNVSAVLYDFERQLPGTR